MVERRGMASLRARLAALAIGSVLVVGVAACGGSDSGEGTTTTVPVETSETTSVTGAEGASELDGSTDGVAVKNSRLNDCTSVMSGERPTTPEAREALRQSQQQCLQQQRSTPPKR